MRSRIRFRVILGDKIDRELIVVEARWWVPGGLLYCSLVLLILKFYRMKKWKRNLHVDDPQLFVSSPASPLNYRPDFCLHLPV